MLDARDVIQVLLLNLLLRALAFPAQPWRCRTRNIPYSLIPLNEPRRPDLFPMGKRMRRLPIRVHLLASTRIPNSLRVVFIVGKLSPLCVLCELCARLFLPISNSADSVALDLRPRPSFCSYPVNSVYALSLPDSCIFLLDLPSNLTNMPVLH